jgi:prophage regulatory protein
MAKALDDGGRAAAPHHQRDAEQFLSRSEVCRLTGLSATTLWREVRAGRFPPPVPLSRSRKGFAASQVRAWASARIASVRGSAATAR